MPLTTEQRIGVIQDLGFSPDEYDLDESNNRLIPKAVNVQPVAGDLTPSTKVQATPTPQQQQFSPGQSFGMNLAHSAIPSLGGGISAAAALGGAGTLLASTGVGAPIGIPLMLLAAGVGGYLGHKGTQALQDAIVPQFMLDELNMASQQNPKSAIAGNIAAMPFGGFNPSPTRALQAVGSGAKLLTTGATTAPELSNMINVGTGAAMGGVTSIAEPLIHGQTPSMGDIASGVGLGALFNNPNALGQRLGFHPTGNPWDTSRQEINPQMFQDKQFGNILATPPNTDIPLEQALSAGGTPQMRGLKVDTKGLVRPAGDAMAKFRGQIDPMEAAQRTMEGEGGPSSDIKATKLEENLDVLNEVIGQKRAELQAREQAQKVSEQRTVEYNKGLEELQALQKQEAELNQINKEKQQLQMKLGVKATPENIMLRGLGEIESRPTVQDKELPQVTPEESAADLEARRLEGNKGDRYSEESPLDNSNINHPETRQDVKTWYEQNIKPRLDYINRLIGTGNTQEAKKQYLKIHEQVLPEEGLTFEEAKARAKGIGWDLSDEQIRNDVEFGSLTREHSLAKLKDVEQKLYGNRNSKVESDRPLTPQEQQLLIDAKETKKSLTPTSAFLKFFKNMGVNVRNFSIDATGNVVDSEGNPVAGKALLRKGLEKAFIAIDKDKGRADTIPHEVTHIFYNDLKNSPRAKDQRVALDLERKVTDSPEFAQLNADRVAKGLKPWDAEEYIANQMGSYALRRGQNMESETVNQRWVKDWASYLKTRYTKHASEEDLLRVLTQKMYHDEPFSKVHGIEDVNAPVVTSPTQERTSEESSIKSAALKDSDGNIYEGGMHYQAYAKVPAEQKHNLEYGFITNDGKFLTRDEAIGVARNAKQLYPKAEQEVDSGQLKQLDIAHLKGSNDPRYSEESPIEKIVKARFAHDWPEMRIGDKLIAPKKRYYHLEEDIPGHNTGSTVTEQSINRAGYKLPKDIGPYNDSERLSESSPIFKEGELKRIRDEDLNTGSRAFQTSIKELQNLSRHRGQIIDKEWIYKIARNFKKIDEPLLRQNLLEHFDGSDLDTNRFIDKLKSTAKLHDSYEQASELDMITAMTSGERNSESSPIKDIVDEIRAKGSILTKYKIPELSPEAKGIEGVMSDMPAKHYFQLLDHVGNNTNERLQKIANNTFIDNIKQPVEFYQPKENETLSQWSKRTDIKPEELDNTLRKEDPNTGMFKEVGPSLHKRLMESIGFKDYTMVEPKYSESSPIKEPARNGVPAHHPSVRKALDAIDTYDWKRSKASDLEAFAGVKDAMLEQLKFGRDTKLRDLLNDVNPRTEEGWQTFYDYWDDHYGSQEWNPKTDKITYDVKPVTPEEQAVVAKEKAAAPVERAPSKATLQKEMSTTKANIVDEQAETKASKERLDAAVKEREAKEAEVEDPVKKKAREEQSAQEWHDVETTTNPQKTGQYLQQEIKRMEESIRTVPRHSLLGDNMVNRLTGLRMKYDYLRSKHPKASLGELAPVERYSNESILGPARPEIDKIPDEDVRKGLSETYRSYSKLRGEFQFPIKKLLSFIDWSSPKNKFIQDSPEMQNVVKRRMDLMDNGTTNIQLTPKEQQIDDVVSEILKSTLDAKNARPNLPYTVANPDYLPQTPSRKVLDVLLNKSASPEARQLLREWDNYYQSLGKTQAEADKAYKIFKGGYVKQQSDLASQFGPIDKTSGLGLPPSWRETNLVDLLTRFTDRYARRLAYYDNVENNPVVQDKLFNPRTGLNAEESTKHILENLMGVREHDEAFRTAVSGVFRAGMLGFLTGSKDVVSSQTLGLQHQNLDQVLPAKLAAWKNVHRNLDESLKAGVNRINVASMEHGDAGVDQITNLLRRSRDVLNTVQGRNFLEKISRALTFGEGQFLAMDNVWRAHNNNLNSQARRFLDNFVPDWQQYQQTGQLTPEALTDAASRYVESVQGTYDYRGLPVIAQKGTFAPYLALARWNIEKLSNFEKMVVNPAIREGDIKPLLMSTVGMIIGGEAVNQLVQMVTGRKERTPKVAEIQQLSAEGKDTFLPITYKLAGLASLSGYGGLLGDVIKSGLDLKFHNRVQTYDNPMISGLSTVGGTLYDAITAIHDGDMESGTQFLSQFMEDMFQTYRIGLAQLDPEKQKEIEQANKMRDLKLFKVTHDEPVGDVLQNRVNPFRDKAIKDFKKTDDLQKAAQMLPNLIAKAFEKAAGNPERLRAELMKIKGNNYQTMPSPESMPQSFSRYLVYLEKTQGKDVAVERFNDYMQQRAINTVKAQMVPTL